jgi:hypothetical protein
MTKTKQNTEVCELKDSELHKINGGIDPVSAWYEALGRLHLKLPDQGNSFTDSLGCQTA